jgi:hypothetical protein
MYPNDAVGVIVGVTDGVGAIISQSKNASISKTLQFAVGDGVGVGHIVFEKKPLEKLGVVL